MGPITAGFNAMTARWHVLGVAERVEADLPINKCFFTAGSPLDGEAPTIPGERIGPRPELCAGRDGR